MDAYHLGVICPSKTKNEVKLPTQSAEIGFVWGNGHLKLYIAISFLKLKDEKWPQMIWPFNPSRHADHFWDNKHQHENSSRDKEKINAVSNNFNFRENDYNLAKNTDFLATSNFNNFANVGPLMTNDGALES